MYKLNLYSWESQPSTVILTKQDGSQHCIPFEPANRDYQEYLKWLAEGNTPEPADE
jgi:hypothetical protein